MNPSDSCEIQSDPTSAYHAKILEETNALFSSDWNQLESSAPVVNRSISRMDVKVFKAAQEGNIDALRAYAAVHHHHREHCNRLHQMLTPIKNTVLHVYIDSIAGLGSIAKSAKSKALLPNSSPAEVVTEMLRMAPRLLLRPNQSGDTALHLAARHGQAKIVGALIQAAEHWQGDRDLEEGMSSTEVCQQFLIRSNKEKNTALHEAVRFGHLDVVKILTEKDPEFLYSANDAGETPLYMAAERGYTDLVSEILKNCTSPSYQGPKGLSALHIAVAYGDEDITRKLVAKDRTLTQASDDQGRTPLHMAVIRGEVSIVKQILECDNSTAYIGDHDKSTPVHYAAHEGYGNVMKQLYLYSPDSFELVDDKGRNALHIAIITNQGEVVKFVREDPWLSSVMLQGKDSDGNTPLHQIAISGSYLGWEYFSDSRVDKMAFNKENKNALDISNDPLQRLGLRTSGARRGRRLLSIRGNSVGKDVDVEKSNRDSKLKDLKESHLVVSALIATVTFAAGFTLPGGYQSEDGPNQGSAVLSRNTAFMAFVISDTLAMCLSSGSIMLHFSMVLGRKEITAPESAIRKFEAAMLLTVWAMVAMVVAFISGIYAVLGGPSSIGLGVASSVIGCYFFVNTVLFFFGTPSIW